LNRHGPEIALSKDHLAEHVVIVGCGRVGRHVADVLGRVGVARLVVEADVTRTKRLQQLAIPVLFGDAANSEVLSHAALARARALVVTVPDDASSLMIVTAARRLAKGLNIIAARVSSSRGYATPRITTVSRVRTAARAGAWRPGGVGTHSSRIIICFLLANDPL
jgi:CPA2 family monovalent cation:H+ antiporter-2